MKVPKPIRRLICQIIGHRWKLMLDKWDRPWPLYCMRCETADLNTRLYSIRQIRDRWFWRKKRGLPNELTDRGGTIEFLEQE